MSYLQYPSYQIIVIEGSGTGGRHFVDSICYSCSGGQYMKTFFFSSYIEKKNVDNGKLYFITLDRNLVQQQ